MKILDEQMTADAVEIFSVIDSLSITVTLFFLTEFLTHNVLFFNYDLNINLNPRYTTFCDLGVTFDSKLYFNTHNTNSSLKISNLLLIQVTNLAISILIFISFVRSKLEYTTI